ncbi:AraC family transcriptional regulator [Dermatophilaceae bacterium Soc4.6]
MREWFAADGTRAPGWWRAQTDPAVGPALSLIHEQPEHHWTLEALASAVGWSRSGLARRFTQVVGEPPMTYLTHWRLNLAADLLADRSLTVETVARRVGYGSGFALSAALLRERGVRPRDLRTVVGAAVPAHPLLAGG